MPGTRQHARTLGHWVDELGLDRADYGPHSMRRTKATLIYRRSENLRALQLLLCRSRLESTVRYLGIEVDDALKALVGRLGRRCGFCRVAFGRHQRSMAHLFAVPLLATPAPACRVYDAGATAAAARVLGHQQLHDVGVAAFCTARKSQARKGLPAVPQT